MHLLQLMENAHKNVLTSIEGLTEAECRRPDVCGVWSVKDIIAHLASFEHLYHDALISLDGTSATPVLDRWLADMDRFNDEEVTRRRQLSLGDVVAEYTAQFHLVIDRYIRTSEARLTKAGVFPWYGMEYDMEDVLLRSYCTHKYEHSAQIEVYRDRLAREARLWEAQLETC